MSEQRGPGRRGGRAHFQLHCSGETRPADEGVERIRTGEWPWGREMRGWWRVAAVWDGGWPGSEGRVLGFPPFRQ